MYVFCLTRTCALQSDARKPRAHRLCKHAAPDRNATKVHTTDTGLSRSVSMLPKPVRKGECMQIGFCEALHCAGVTWQSYRQHWRFLR